MKKIDFHIHTTHSDGSLTLSEVMKELQNCGITNAAITDHDTIINMRNYQELGRKYGIRIIPGIELNVDFSNMHILGYGITDFEFIENKILEMKRRNVSICLETIRLLYERGIRITQEDVLKSMPEGSIITKRDIAKYLVKTGYARNNLEVYELYIGRKCKAYVPLEKLNYLDAIQLIINAGGFASLAHPYSLGENVDLNLVISIMKESGLRGIETITPRHTSAQVKCYKSIAKRFDLIETAGSDFHRYSDNILFGVDVEDELLDKFNAELYTKGT